MALFFETWHPLVKCHMNEHFLVVVVFVFQKSRERERENFYAMKNARWSSFCREERITQKKFKKKKIPTSHQSSSSSSSSSSCFTHIISLPKHDV